MAASAEAFDGRERRDRAEREAALFIELRLQAARAKARAPYYRATFADVDPDALVDRAALARLPILRKSALIELQEHEPPFGGVATDAAGAMARLFLSPGPIAEPQGRGEDNGGGDHWRFGRAFHAAGVRPGDVVLNCFSYHLTPAGLMFDGAARGAGCAVVPGGVGATETQVDAIARFGIDAYVGTPDFLKIIVEKAEAMDRPIPSLKKALVTGGPLFPQTRAFLEERGVRVRQCYGTAELGLVAYETDDPADGMVIEETCIVEIVRPGTGEPVPAGEVGEVVVTTFDPAYPLIRFATGDLSALIEGPRPCGRTNDRIKGWMGRADQPTKVRGMFVHPEQVARVVAAHPEIHRARLEVAEAGGKDQVKLVCEVDAPSPDLAAAIGEKLQTEIRVRGEVAFVEKGALPNDGKVIDDKRDLAA